MSVNWSTFRELLIAPGTRRGVESALREAIRTGRLPAGTRLPSSRDLSSQLGVARGTVTLAYTQLAAEGYLVSRRGSGTVVSQSVSVSDLRAGEDAAPEPVWRHDLRPGLPALSAFPRSAWLAATRAGLAGLTDAELGYPDPAGLAALRAELAAYLGRVRAVACTPANIVVTNGAAEGTTLLAQVLHAAGHDRVAVENPRHPGQAELFAAHGLTPVPIPVDEDGLIVDNLTGSGARVVMATTAHQFPLGVAMRPHRRMALLAWAKDVDGLVIEDDYDAEHRYDTAPVSALQALDPERIAYQGSVSKTLAPALRIGWVVAPAPLRAELVTRKRLHDLGGSQLAHAAMAHLLRTGGYDRHLRSARQLYRRRRDALLAALAEHLPDWTPVGVAAGLHLVVRLPEDTDDAELAAALAAEGVHVMALSGYAHAGTTPPYPGLVLGYALLSPDRLRAAVADIARTVGSRRHHG
ncbi:MAG TPA: PLP-dependent aminotransferase family protein [Pseudonocardiaceae bacterium]|nr:PLP-dependent aminotransferase family protein [Pseudonocardiaceae bacterium]